MIGIIFAPIYVLTEYGKRQKNTFQVGAQVHRLRSNPKDARQ
jgi:hypothetical protein